MGDICGDNRFEIIAKAKKNLLESTNIHTSEDEMKVLDSFLFRCWQMGWLKRYDKPRETLDIPTMSTDFVKEHGLPCPDGYIFKDENGNVINATKIVLEKKKKEYPKTYKECREILKKQADVTYGYKKDVLHSFQKLLVCRDAYWKIAGEEMGLGKSWQPDWTNQELLKYCIANVGGQIKTSERYIVNTILTFPTEEMRNAFYENFKELIESCKELL